jgi:hypothetical protein
MCSKQYKCTILFNYHGEMCNVYVYVWFLINTLYRVMAIRGPEDVYNGHDYLPSYFNSLIDSSNVMAFVVVHGDEFVRH